MIIIIYSFNLLIIFDITRKMSSAQEQNMNDGKENNISGAIYCLKFFILKTIVLNLSLFCLIKQIYLLTFFT